MDAGPLIGDRSAVTVPEWRTTVAMAHPTAVEHVRTTFERHGFHPVTEFSPANRIIRNEAGSVPPYTVLGFGIPEAADHALSVADPRIGVLFPCTVAIWEVDQNIQQVYTVDSLRMAPYLGFSENDDSWRTLIGQLENALDRVFSTLEK